MEVRVDLDRPAALIRFAESGFAAIQKVDVRTGRSDVVDVQLSK